jgi:hypothetical protein
VTYCIVVQYIIMQYSVGLEWSAPYTSAKGESFALQVLCEALAQALALQCAATLAHWDQYFRIESGPAMVRT